MIPRLDSEWRGSRNASGVGVEKSLWDSRGSLGCQGGHVVATLLLEVVHRTRCKWRCNIMMCGRCSAVCLLNVEH